MFWREEQQQLQTLIENREKTFYCSKNSWGISTQVAKSTTKKIKPFGYIIVRLNFTSVSREKITIIN